MPLHGARRGFDPLIGYCGLWIVVGQRIQLSTSRHAPVVELVYMLGLEPSAFGIESSNLSGCTSTRAEVTVPGLTTQAAASHRLWSKCPEFHKLLGAGLQHDSHDLGCNPAMGNDYHL